MMKNMAVIVIIILVALALVRLLTPEDKWVCDNGQWVAHGRPSSEKPKGVCQDLFRW